MINGIDSIAAVGILQQFMLAGQFDPLFSASIYSSEKMEAFKKRFMGSFTLSFLSKIRENERRSKTDAIRTFMGQQSLSYQGSKNSSGLNF